MIEIPKKFKLELDEMDNLFPTIQDLRHFKDNYDNLLVNNCERDTLGRITGGYPWGFVAGRLIGQLNELNPAEGTIVYVDFSAFDKVIDPANCLVNCGQVAHVLSPSQPYWQLVYQ